MQVTNVQRLLYKGTKKEKAVTGFYMQPYLKYNLDAVLGFLEKAWDCVGIVSGHGKVRIGKSTLAAQLCFYLAWIIAGGRMITNEKNQVVDLKLPDKPVRFNLQENVVFSAEDLQNQAMKLYNKYGPNQVIMYDEGRQGLDSARAMENINKGMQDFFQECGFMGHVIIIVLPSFFKLHEDYAVARSLFLVDVFADKEYNRGYYNFYNEKQKEYLYYFGKRMVGVTAKYNATSESFWGKFTKWLPFDKDEYEQLKKEAVAKKNRTRRERNQILQRDFFLWLLKKNSNFTYAEIQNEYKKFFHNSISIRTLRESMVRIQGKVEEDLGFKLI